MVRLSGRNYLKIFRRIGWLQRRATVRPRPFLVLPPNLGQCQVRLSLTLHSPNTALFTVLHFCFLSDCVLSMPTTHTYTHTRAYISTKTNSLLVTWRKKIIRPMRFVLHTSKHSKVSFFFFFFSNSVIKFRLFWAVVVPSYWWLITRAGRSLVDAPLSRS